MDAYERVTERLNEMGRKPAQLYAHLGMDSGLYSRAMKNRRGFDGHWVKITEFLDVSLDWLLLGEGPKEPRKYTELKIEINHALATENAMLRAQVKALKEMYGGATGIESSSDAPPKSTTLLGAGQNELERGVPAPAAPGSDQEPVSHPRPSPPHLRSGDGA